MTGPLRCFAIALALWSAGIGTGALAQSTSPIISEFTQFIPYPREKVFAIVADVRNHAKLLRNIKGRIVIPRSEMTREAIAENEIIAMSFVYEPSNRLAVTRFKLYPPRLIEEEMVTSPFDEVGILDKKRGKVSYIFEEASGGTKFIARSEFYPSTGRVYQRDWIDNIWRDFIRNLEREASR
jgi:hypothetical protein